MGTIFLDAWYIIALINKRDEYHERVVMRDAGIVEALTHDRHFTQAGFVALMRETIN